MSATKQTSRIAGWAYLWMGVPGAFSLQYVPNAIVVRGDAAATAARMAASQLLVRASMVSALISGVGWICLVLLLHQLLKRVNPRHAALMVIFVLVAVPISFLNVVNEAAALILTSGAPYLSAIPKPQLDALAMAFLQMWNDGNHAAEVFSGLWLLPFGMLVYRSRFLPRILGVFLVVGGFAYVIHSLTSFLFPGHQPLLYQVALLAAWTAAELPIALWLLIKGAELPATEER